MWVGTKANRFRTSKGNPPQWEDLILTHPFTTRTKTLWLKDLPDHLPQFLICETPLIIPWNLKGNSYHQMLKSKELFMQTPMPTAKDFWWMRGEMTLYITKNSRIPSLKMANMIKTCRQTGSPTTGETLHQRLPGLSTSKWTLNWWPILISQANRDLTLTC